MQIRKTLPLALSFNVSRLTPRCLFLRRSSTNLDGFKLSWSNIRDIKMRAPGSCTKGQWKTDLLRYDTRAVFRLSSHDRPVRLLNS